MIHIIDDYYALSNNYGYTAIRNAGKVDKKGNPVYVTLGYCGNLKEVLQLVIKDKVHSRVSMEDMELEQALEHIREQTDRVMDALKGIEV